jgi:predicted transcriptional regulator of viral defense system
MTLAGHIREAAKDLKEFSPKDISDTIGVCSYRERKYVREQLCSFLRRGEIERIDHAFYRYLGRKEKERVTFRQRLWDISRRMIHFTFSDLVQITEGNRGTIQEFCSWMVQQGYARRISRGHYRITEKLKPVVPINEKIKR